MARTDRLSLRPACLAALARVRAAVAQDYPALCGWLAPLPWETTVRTGDGEDDWRWIRPSEVRVGALRGYPARVVAVAASRVSQVYGLGAGSEWVARHGLQDIGQPDERAAEAEARASLRSIGARP